LGSSKKLDLETEIEPESDTILDGMGDLDDVDDLDDLSLDEDSSGNQVLQSTSKRVRMIFSVMASPNRIDILRILNSKGPLTYSELKSLAGFKSKKESGKFAYHLRKLLRQSLVALNKSERRYTITNLGKLVLSLARQIEERSIIESGKMYVRTSHDSIEEFNSQKIIQSLVREGSLPLELAQKITEEVENRIYKYQTAYLTGSLIRELVNSVLLEHGHEEYRHKLARVGLPTFEVQEMITNTENVDSGIEGLLFKTGQIVFAEHLLTNTLPKDIADAHLSGDLHITNLGLWSILPDAVFINVKTLIEDGIDLKGKSLGVCRIPSVKTLDHLSSALSMIIALISKEASQEVVMDDLIPLLSKYSKNLPELERKLVDSFTTSFTSIGYNKTSTVVSFRIPLGTEQKIVKKVQKRKYNIQRIDGLEEKKVTPPEEVYERINKENKLIAKARAINSDLDFFRNKFIIPVDDAIITGVYGSQRILNGKPKWPHYGLDFAQKEGTAVKAMLNGTVTLAEPDLYYTGGTLIFGLKPLLPFSGTWLKKAKN